MSRPAPNASAARHAAQSRAVATARATGEPVAIADLPAGGMLVHVLGIDYVQMVTREGGDLYLTAHGLPLADHLQPERWFAPDWFRGQAERLEGTSAVYALPTRPLDGKSVPIVAKFSRVGERVPIDTMLIDDLLCCEFNGPFEEFALLEELRHSRRGPPGLSVLTQRPLAIYVPPGRSQPSQLERFQWRVARKVAQHPGIAIDIMRQYLMLYSWLPGIDAWEAHGMGLLSLDDTRALNERAMTDLRAKGFSVLDMKPQHVIVELVDGHRLATTGGDAVDYGVVDFELLERTTEHWQEVQAERRATYARLGRGLGDAAGSRPPDEVDNEHEDPAAAPRGDRRARILGVDYVAAPAPSTGGWLWVVGRDDALVDFFLPERWRTTAHLRLIEDHETYGTISKDRVRLVWKVSRVGERPESAAFGAAGFRVLAHGFNSPFEEIGLALWLDARGVPTTRPRAIYRTGHRSLLDESLFDSSRYRSHAGWQTAAGEPVLEPRRSYITVWDHWRGPDTDIDGVDEAPVFRALDVAQATERGLLDDRQASTLLDGLGGRIEKTGVEVLRLTPRQVLVALGPDELLLRDDGGTPCHCLCGLQHLRWRTPPR